MKQWQFDALTFGMSCCVWRFFAFVNNYEVFDSILLVYLNPILPYHLSFFLVQYNIAMTRYPHNQGPFFCSESGALNPIWEFVGEESPVMSIGTSIMSMDNFHTNFV